MDLTSTTLPTPPPDPAALLAAIDEALAEEQRLNMNRPRAIRLTRMQSLTASLRACLPADGAPAA